MNQVKPIIRRPRLDEVDQIEAFFNITLRDTFIQNNISHLEELFEEEITDKKKHLDEDFKTNGERRYFLVAEYEGEIIGSIAYGPTSNLMNECTKNKTKHMLEMGSVYVHPKYQRMGIVNLLIAELIMKLKEEDVETICFDSGYPIAQKVWCKKMGEPKYFIKDCWGEGSHHMVWQIDVDNVLINVK